MGASLTTHQDLTRFGVEAFFGTDEFWVIVGLAATPSSNAEKSSERVKFSTEEGKDGCMPTMLEITAAYSSFMWRDRYKPTWLGARIEFTPD